MFDINLARETLIKGQLWPAEQNIMLVVFSKVSDFIKTLNTLYKVFFQVSKPFKTDLTSNTVVRKPVWSHYPFLFVRSSSYNDVGLLHDSVQENAKDL